MALIRIMAVELRGKRKNRMPYNSWIIILPRQVENYNNALYYINELQSLNYSPTTDLKEQVAQQREKILYLECELKRQEQRYAIDIGHNNIIHIIFNCGR